MKLNPVVPDDVTPPTCRVCGQPVTGACAFDPENLTGNPVHLACCAEINNIESAKQRRLAIAAPEMLSELRNVLRCYERDTVPARRVDGPNPGTLTKITDKAAERIRLLLAKFPTH